MDTHAMTRRLHLPEMRRDPGTSAPERPRPARYAYAGWTIAAVVLCYLADQAGWWWVTMLAGIAAAARWRGRALAAYYVLVPLAAWGGNLLYLAAGQTGLNRVARVTAGFAGFGNNVAWLGYLATLLYAVLLCAAGGWLAAATMRFIKVLREPAANPDAGSASAQPVEAATTEEAVDV